MQEIAEQRCRLDEKIPRHLALVVVLVVSELIVELKSNLIEADRHDQLAWRRDLSFDPLAAPASRPRWVGWAMASVADAISDARHRCADGREWKGNIANSCHSRCYRLEKLQLSDRLAV